MSNLIRFNRLKNDKICFAEQFYIFINPNNV